MKRKYYYAVALCFTLFTVEATAQDNANSISQKKVEEVKRLVKISAKQQKDITNIALQYQESLDSVANYNAKDEVETAGKIKARANETYHITLMDILDDEQRKSYLENSVKGNVERKSKIYLTFLKDSGKYSETELNTYYEEIYNYLLSRDAALARYKYDPAKSKQVDKQTKKQRPQSYLNARALQKAAATAGSGSDSQWDDSQESLIKAK